MKLHGSGIELVQVAMVTLPHSSRIMGAFLEA